MSEQLDIEMIRARTEAQLRAPCSECCKETAKAMEFLLAEVTRLREENERLRYYADHDGDCAVQHDEPCSCGLSSLLSSPHEEIGQK